MELTHEKGTHSKRAFAILINPRLGDLLFAFNEGAEISILTMGSAEIGSGFLDSKDAVARIAGLPRAHTPGGVENEGAGYGTVLYTALCTAAHLAANGRLRDMDVPSGADGISSLEGTRTDAAERWWSRAKRVYGLAHAITRCEVEADVYPYVNAQRRHLIVGWFDPTDVSARERRRSSKRFHGIEFDPSDLTRSELSITQVDPAAVRIESRPALESANVGRLKSDAGPFADDVFAWLVKLARHAGVSDSVIRDMKSRYEREVDLDPEAYAAQADDLAWQLEPVRPPPKKNPRPRETSSRADSSLYVAKRLPQIRPKFYREAKTNPRGEMESSLERLAKRRQALGWTVWQADDEAP